MYLKRLLSICGLSLAVLTMPHTAHAAPPELHRGLNLSSWLANAPRQPLSGRDFAMIKSAGFDHVRLPFNPEYVGYKLTEEDGNPAKVDFSALDRAVAMAAQYELPVIVDLHVGQEFTQTLEDHLWAEKKVAALWAAMAERYKSYPASEVLFEPLNEPQYYKAEKRWMRVAGKVTEAIRKISPDRIVIIGAPHGSEIDGLPFLETSNDPNIIYAFHFYEPYAVTHQGIHMGFENRMLRYFRNMPYPSDLATQPAAAYAPTAPKPEQAARELAEYTGAPWGSDHIKARIDIARDWAAAHHVRVLCGEYGVLRNHIDPESRYRWINDARSAMDADRIGWELWDYADLFGIVSMAGTTSTDAVDGSVRLVDPEKGSRAFEPAALTALGLKTP